ncbi:uncharacterized protein METZ01_LOCUS263758 [marine metagenome]|uniref:Uncharacterized protein n=1 Tax=marine metagenome TaxID=408172 RepID=A0A382JF02_9ZZZZ
MTPDLIRISESHLCSEGEGKGIKKAMIG